jgi:hypothetical protein
VFKAYTGFVVVLGINAQALQVVCRGARLYCLRPTWDLLWC